MTAGLAFEGLNHAGIENSNLLVVLNDNCMSIDPNVGALKDYLLKISTSKVYNETKNEIWSLLGKLSKFGSSAKEIVKRTEKALKSSLLKNSNLFESLNFRYFGPVDGHNIEKLVETFEKLKPSPGLKFFIVLPLKGKVIKLLKITKQNGMRREYLIKILELLLLLKVLMNLKNIRMFLVKQLLS